METNIFSKDLYFRAGLEAFKKLNPKTQIQNPVMFVTEIGAFLTSLVFLSRAHQGDTSSFDLQISLWLWFTVIFANFSEAIAEGRGKAQAESLKKARSDTQARLLKDGREIKVNANALRLGDLVVCEAGDVVPGDGEVVSGIATVDESAITGESAPVIRESGGDRSAVTGGTRVISDRIVVKMTAEAGHTFLDRMIQLVEGASRQKTPNEIALEILLVSLTVVFILVVLTLKGFGAYSDAVSKLDGELNLGIPVLMALLICLIPTTIGGLLSAIGISGMDRLVRKNVIATSGRAVEAAGDVDVLLLDKTGTITHGNRMAVEFLPAPGVGMDELARKAMWASQGDETPEGKSIISLATEKFHVESGSAALADLVFLPFSAQTRMSGMDHTEDGKAVRLRKGAADAIRAFVEGQGGAVANLVLETVDRIGRKGGTPLVVAQDRNVLGVIYLKDVVKTGIKERFAELRRMGIKTVMITGDNPLTAAAIAAEAGVDDFMAEATPEDKLKRIREEQEKGHLVAMTGDGTNDAPALAQADVGVAMNTGTQAAREAGNMVDLDSNPTKLIEVVETGKQLLMTRGALTTFSIANDIAKYFAILPALFSVLYATSPQDVGPLSVLNIMKLHSPESAILSAVIFNALIIVILIPLALRGVQYRPVGASGILRRNLLIYGLGGVLAPFVGIKAIDLVIVAGGLV